VQEAVPKQEQMQKRRELQKGKRSFISIQEEERRVRIR
jgi:hypothetical protein